MTPYDLDAMRYGVLFDWGVAAKLFYRASEIYLKSYSNPFKVTNVTVLNLAYSAKGGFMTAEDGSINVQIANSSFSRCAAIFGGALVAQIRSAITVTNCQFIENSAFIASSFLANSIGTIIVQNSTFISNVAF
jgi:hypothetical protein